MGDNFSDKKGIFREYDIRGIYPTEIDEALVKSIVSTLAQKLFIKGKVVLGYDPRKSSPSLRQAALEALERFNGIEVVDVGLITTPALYFLVNRLNAAGGIAITASHNPKEYNGLKVVGKEAVFVGGKEVFKLMQ
ncbi:MAG: hypothetical protein Q8P99_03010 [bacterium]|nr:hypothetical protein [bacterium]MDZ4231563.1 hypothetical protein [Patescibacteria group bacterium]